MSARQLRTGELFRELLRSLRHIEAHAFEDPRVSELAPEALAIGEELARRYTIAARSFGGADDHDLYPGHVVAWLALPTNAANMGTPAGELAQTCPPASSPGAHLAADPFASPDGAQTCPPGPGAPAGELRPVAPPPNRRIASLRSLPGRPCEPSRAGRASLTVFGREVTAGVAVCWRCEMVGHTDDTCPQK